MTIQKVEEKSLELALVKAAGLLGITQDQMEYKVVGETAGFLGMFGKKVSIEAWKRGSHRNPRNGNHRQNNRNSKSTHERREYREPREETPKRELSATELKELKQDLQTFTANICQYMTGEEVEVDVSTDDKRLILDIQHEGLAAQASRNPKLSESLEHILRKKPRHLRQELPFRIFVDFDSSRQSREDELVTMAKDLSNKVHENKRPIVLNYRNSYDRKIIHMALDQDDRVYTKSIGNGPNRKLMILPSKEDGAMEAHQ